MITIDESGIEVDAAALAEALGLDPEIMRERMRKGEITSRCERGIGEDEGRWRLTFFSDNRRLRLLVDEDGNILYRTAIDFGEQPLPASIRGSQPE